MTDERRTQIKNMLYKDGINIVIIDRMTDAELEQADSYNDYYEYNRFMDYMARKYDV